MFKKTGVYIIENIKNGKCYIGSTKSSFQLRLNSHFRDLRKGEHHSSILQSSYNKHGSNCFKSRILEVCDACEVREKEQQWIDFMNPEYNIKKKVDWWEPSFTDEYRRKLSKSLGGKPVEICDLEGNLITTVDTQYAAADYVGSSQANISQCLRGVSKTSKGYMFRFKGEDFTYKPKKRKTSKLRGYRHSEETRRNMSRAKKGKKLSIEHRSKISDSLKKQWEQNIRVPQKKSLESRVNIARRSFNSLLVVTDKKGKELFTCWCQKDAADIIGGDRKSITKVLSGKRKSYLGYKFYKKSLVTSFPLMKSKKGLKENKI